VKTSEYAKTGIVTAFDPGVVKSDTAIPQDLQEKHRAVVKPLEDISDEEKDYHPSSDRKAVDLAHPSLFPLVYGRTRVLRDKVFGTDNCFNSVGQGSVIKIDKNTEPSRMSWRGLQRMNIYSERFQWLPCHVKFGPNGECQIASYINNLHPARHKNLYHIIEQIITRTMPLWNVSGFAWGFDTPHPFRTAFLTYPAKSPSLNMTVARIMTSVTRNGKIGVNRSDYSHALFSPPSLTCTSQLTFANSIVTKGCKLLSSKY
jgi:hypothetical protein